MLPARPTAGPIPGVPDACQAIQEWGGLDSRLGLGAQACGESRAGILDLHGTWSLFSLPPPTTHTPAPSPGSSRLQTSCLVL